MDPDQDTARILDRVGERQTIAGRLPWGEEHVRKIRPSVQNKAVN